MLGKNNFDERLRKMEMQAKNDRFSIRKLSVGAVSVLLGFSFLSFTSQTVKADVVNPDKEDVQTSTNNSINENTEEQHAANAPKKTQAAGNKLDTYSGLTAFLKESGQTLADNPASMSSSPEDTLDSVAASASSDFDISSSSDSAVNDNNSNTSVAGSTVATSSAASSPATDITDENNQTASSNQDISVSPKDEERTGSINFNTPSRPTSDAKNGVSNYGTTKDALVQVGNWKDFKDALTNKNIHNIEIINNIRADGSSSSINLPPRKLIIKSGGDNIPANGYIIDFRSSSPLDSDNYNTGKMDVTYQDLQLYCQNYLGLMDTVDGTDGPSRITLDNVKFTGSQVLYSGQYTDVHIKNNFSADVVAFYKNPLNAIDQNNYDTYGLDGQQAFELSENGERITFEKGSKAVLSTSDGNVIEMNNGASSADNVNNIFHDEAGNLLSNTSQVILEEGADVTLNPRKNPGRYDETAQNTSKASGIVFRGGYGNITVNRNAKLTINIGSDTNGADDSFAGQLDRHRAAAITLTGAGGKIIDNGTIDINTNGDISGNSYGKENTLVYDGGDLTINPGAELNVIGKNMQGYSGTLIYVGGTADLENGSLDIELQGDSTGAGAGIGKIVLVDVAAPENGGESRLTVNNPRKLVLNASANHAQGTSIIGDSEIDIRNVRQHFDFGKLSLTLPPFHELKVRHDSASNTITVIDGGKGISVLGGKNKPSDDVIKQIGKDISKPENAGLAFILAQALGQPIAVADPAHPTVAEINQAVATVNGTLQVLKNLTFDQIFAKVIYQAFSNPDNPGYNNITMLPANSKGFLNIQDTNGNLGKASYKQNADGSVTVSGKITNYDAQTDGPACDPIFSNVMPTGTNAYVTATINGTSYKDSSVKDPYATTNDGPDGLTNDLPHEFAAQVDANGSFTFTIPASYGLKPGDTIDIEPEANFIGYDPNGKDSRTPAITLQDDVLTPEQIQDQAAEEMAAAAAAAKERVQNSGLSAAEQASYNTAIDNTVAAATTKPTLATGAPNPNYDPNKSVYGSTDFSQINDKKNSAKNAINKEAAKAEVQAYLNAAKADLGKAGITDDFLTQAANDAIAAVDQSSAEEMAAAEANAKNKILADYQTAAKTAIGKMGPDASVINGLHLSNSEKGKYNQAINDAKTKYAANLAGLTGSGLPSDFTGANNASGNISDAQKEIDKANAQAHANSELNKYRDDQLALYPNAAAGINSAADSGKNVIDNETNIANLQDAQHNNATATNRGDITDVKNGMDAIDAAVQAYKKGLKDNIKDQVGGDNGLLNQVNNAEQGTGLVPDTISKIDSLKNELNDALGLAADGTGDIDQANDGQHAEAAHQTAQNNIDDAKNRLDAINQLQAAADAAAAANPAAADDIHHALNDAINNVINSAKDTDKNKPIENARDQGKNAIGNVIKHKQSATAINAAAAAAHKQVNDSNATKEQKEKYNAAIDQAVNDALAATGDASINAAANDNELGKRQQTAINKINKEAAKAEVAGYAEEAKEKQDITSDTGVDNAASAATASGTGTIDAIPNDGVDAATAIADAVETAKKNIFTAAQASADKQLADKEKDVEKGLDQLTSLTPEEIAALKAQAKDLVTNSNHTGAKDKVDSATGLDDVGSALHDGLSALNNLLNDQIKKDKKAQAITAINNKRDEALAALDKDKGNYPDLTDEHRNQLKQDAINAAAAGVAAVNGASDDQVATDETTTINNIDHVLANASSDNATDKEDKENATLNARKEAKNKLDAAKKQAEDKVNSYSDDRVSQTQKKKILDQIAADYNAALNNINTATNQDAINNAELVGAINMGNDADKAALEAAKSDAIAELDNAQAKDDGLVDAALDGGKITQQQHDAMKDKIHGFYMTGVSNINGATEDTKDEIVGDRNNAINAMNGVADSIADATLANVKNDALNKEDTGLTALANQIKNHIDHEANLSTDEKNKYKRQVDDALSAAKTNVNGATTPDDVTIAYNAGKGAMLAVQAAADLYDAQNAAKNKLDDQLAAVDNALDGLTNTDAASLAALKDDVQAVYNNAINQVNNPEPATPSVVASAANAGYQAMQDILNRARGLSQTKADNKKALDDAASAANGRIDKSNLTDEQKAAAHAAINQARDDAKKQIDQSTTDTIDKANQVKEDGLTNIQKAEAAANKAHLDGLKAQANKDIDQACDTAEADLYTEFNKLTAAQPAEAKPAYDQAHKDIEAARTEGHNKVNADTANETDIGNAVSEAKNAVNTAVIPAYLAIAKTKGKQAIKDYADQIKNQLTNQKDKAQVDSIVQAGNDEIDKNDQTIDAVNDTVASVKQRIKNIKTAADSAHAAEISKAKDDAINKLNHELNGDPAGNKIGVLDQIEALKDHLTGDQKAKYENQAKDAYTHGVADINGSSNVADINSARDTGITKIDQALADAKLQAAKNDANKRIENDAQDAKKKINDTNLSAEDKSKLIAEVDNAVSAAASPGAEHQVNNAVDQATIDGIVSDAEKNLKNIVDSANNAALLQAQADAKNKLENKAKELTDKIAADKKADKLSQTQADQLNAAVNKELATAEHNIAAATDQQGVATAENNGESALAGASDDINKDEAQKADLDAIAAAVTAANKQIDDINKDHPGDLSPEQIAHLRDEVENTSKDIVNQINQHRKDQSNAIEHMNDVKDNGLDRFKHITDHFTDKENAVNKLEHHASVAEAGLTTTNPDYAHLSKPELAAANEAVEAALNSGRNDIYTAGKDDDLDTIEQNAENQIDQALLPSKLQNEKNKQLAAINDYASSKGNAAIDGLNNLSADEKTKYKQQIENARKKSADKITGTNLPTNPTSTQYQDALNAVDNAEQGTAAADFGQTAIDKIVNEAKLNSKKRQVINDLEQAAQTAKNENSGASASAIDDLVNQAKEDIGNSNTSDAADSASPDAIKNEAVGKINKLVDQAKISGQKEQTAKNMKQKKDDAEKIIDRSQLTDEQKTAAKKKLDALYNDAVTRLNNSGTTEDGHILSPNGYVGAAQMIENDFAKMADRIIKEIPKITDSDGTHPSADAANHPWFGNEADNAHADLSNQWNDFKDHLTSGQKDKYGSLIDTVNQSIANLDQSKTSHDSSIEDATATYDKGLTALNKLRAIKEIEDQVTAANNAIDGTNSLNTDQKNAYKEQIKQNAQKAIDRVNGIAPTDNDQIGNQDKITGAKQNDLQNIVNTAKDKNAGLVADAKQNAIAAINAAYAAAKQKLGAAYQPNGQLDQAKQHELDKLNGLSVAGINEGLNDAIKNVAKAALDDAASYANDQIDQLTHYTNAQGQQVAMSNDEKQALKDQVKQDVETGKNNIDNAYADPADTDAVNTTDKAIISGARNDAINEINKDYTDQAKLNHVLDNNDTVKLDRAQEQAAKDLAAMHQAAVDKLHEQYGPNADTSKADAAYNNHKTAIGTSVDDVKTDELAAQKEIAQGAISDGANNAKQEIDKSNHTSAEKEALKGQIAQDATAADKVITGANAATVNGAMNDQLDIIAADGKGNSSEDTNAMTNSLAVQKERDQAKLDAERDQAVKDLHDKFGNQADTSKIDQATQAAKQAIDQATSAAAAHASEATGEKEISKGAVQDGQIAAGKLIEGITHGKAGKPYSQHEKNALTNAVQGVVNTANGANGSQGELDMAADINQARQDALQNILDIVTDGSAKNQAALDGDQAVEHDREVAAAQEQEAKDLAALHQAAVDKLHEQYGPNADTSKVDAAYNNHKTAIGTSVDDVKADELAAQKEIAQGAVSDGANNAKKEIDQSNHTTAEKEALNGQIAQDAAAADKVITGANATTVNGAMNDQLDIIAADGKGDSANDASAMANSLAVQKEHAKQEVANGAAAANTAVDGLTNHQNGKPYTAAEKQAIKDQIAKYVDEANHEANGTIDQAADKGQVTSAKQDALDKISHIKDAVSGNDDSVLKPIWDNDKNVQKDRIDQAAQAVKDEIDSDPNKPAADKAKDKQKITDAANAAKNKIDHETDPSHVKDDGLQGQKDVAKLMVQAAADKAKEQIDHFKDPSGNGYNDEVKNHLKNEIDQLVNNAINGEHGNDGTIDHAADEAEINKAETDTINAISHVLAPSHIQDVINQVYLAHVSVPIPTVKPVVATDKGTKQTLMHNAYLYNENGVRANSITLRHGSAIRTYGEKVINGRKFFIVKDNGETYYLAQGNINSTNRVLGHNAYLYNQYGILTGKRKYRKYQIIHTFGDAVRIHGKSYYCIGANQFIRASNVLHRGSNIDRDDNPLFPTIGVKKKVMHDAYLYDKDGQSTDGVMIAAGSVAQVSGSEIINGKKYYRLLDGKYIAEGNFDAKKTQLTHNAYVYNKYGERIGKKVLPKNQYVNTYGAPVSIRGKKYFVVSANKFVKQANFAKK
ncbi:SLAP domain-containing protein [Lactobacillus sp. ESL0791]|uniref:SLAP domain-containing protein n=1 Tax=Lactobacillus sp. ESL0791 TaxID=2983234 RepID=UPI0023F62DD4|nr:SLAP domain-containing protein [Lactobacillus sp. ESL0791]MDF7638696.1 SLAP domain-containing protein [Lactobacillus sp. ESL0791]